MRRFHWIALAFCVFASFGLAIADESVVSRMEAFIVTETTDGNERTEPATTAEPGSLVEYRVTYTNVSDTPVRSLIVNGPVPPNTRYVAESAASENADALEVSIDGGTTFEAEPVMRTITQPDGTEREEIIPPHQYTHVRWLAQAALEPAATVVYRYRVRVNL